MAVYAAHLTRSLGGPPSVFAAAAQDALADTLKPALQRLVQYVAAVYPSKLGWTEEWYDELYLLFDCCLQYHYLKHYAASFSESFYGLMRVPVSPGGEFGGARPRLPAPLERASLAALVLLPYLRDRLVRAVQRWRERHEDGTLGKTAPDRARVAAIKLYAIAHLVWEGVKLAQLARYVRGSAPQHAPALAALGLALRDAPPRDQPDHSWGDLLRSMLTGQIGSARVTFPMVGGLALRGAEYGAFGVQLLRWWAARGTLAPRALPHPPPPPLRDERAARYRSRCPLCLQPWRTPTALPVSGYVFCYTCVSRHVRAHAACPVTRAPAAERSLVRLYLPD